MIQTRKAKRWRAPLLPPGAELHAREAVAQASALTHKPVLNTTPHSKHRAGAGTGLAHSTLSSWLPLT